MSPLRFLLTWLMTFVGILLGFAVFLFGMGSIMNFIRARLRPMPAARFTQIQCRWAQLRYIILRRLPGNPDAPKASDLPDLAAEYDPLLVPGAATPEQRAEVERTLYFMENATWWELKRQLAADHGLSPQSALLPGLGRTAAVGGLEAIQRLPAARRPKVEALLPGMLQRIRPWRQGRAGWVKAETAFQREHGLNDYEVLLLLLARGHFDGDRDEAAWRRAAVESIFVTVPFVGLVVVSLIAAYSTWLARGL